MKIIQDIINALIYVFGNARHRIVLYIVLIIIFIVLYWYKYILDKGKIAEKKLAHKLTYLKNDCDRILTNVYLPRNEKLETTEIDSILITERGIFVFESKAYSGKIYGNSKSEEWIQYIDNENGNFKCRFQNPIHQNALHIKCLKEFLQKQNIDTSNIPILSFIIFDKKSYIARMKVSSDIAFVLRLPFLPITLHWISYTYKQVITTMNIEKIYNILQPFSNPPKEVKQRHIENLKVRHNDYE